MKSHAQSIMSQSTDPIGEPMGKDLIVPSNMIALDSTLLVEVGFTGERGTKPTSLTTLFRTDKLLMIEVQTDPARVLKDFHICHTQTKYKCVLINAYSMNTTVNLVAFKALEVGFRVYIILNDQESIISAPLLRLLNAGVSVLSRTDFMDEVNCVETLRASKAGI